MFLPRAVISRPSFSLCHFRFVSDTWDQTRLLASRLMHLDLDMIARSLGKTVGNGYVAKEISMFVHRDCTVSLQQKKYRIGSV